MGQGKLFDFFKGDFIAMSVYSFLKHKGNGLFTLRDLAIHTGINRRNLAGILSRLNYFRLISSRIKKNRGVYVEILPFSGAKRTLTGSLPHHTGLKQHLLDSSGAKSIDIGANKGGLTAFSEKLYSGSSLQSHIGDKSPHPKASALGATVETITSFSLSEQTPNKTNENTSELSDKLDNPCRQAGVRSKSKAKIKPIPFTDEDLETAADWYDFAVSSMKWSKPYASWTVENFAIAINNLRRKTDLNHEGVRAVLKFVKEDDFWGPNSLSPAGLLKKSSPEKLRKIDYILQRIKPASLRQMERIDQWKPLTDEEKANPFLMED